MISLIEQASTCCPVMNLVVGGNELDTPAPLNESRNAGCQLRRRKSLPPTYSSPMFIPRLLLANLTIARGHWLKEYHFGSASLGSATQ